MAGFITALDFEHKHDPFVSVGYFYSGRGEQIANLIATAAPVSAADQAWNLFTKNVGEMSNLFLDRNTHPAPIDYWNPRGRLMPWWVLPMLLIGLGRAVWLSRRRTGYRWRTLVLVFFGFTLPLLLTSQVHIGRLIFAVPLICLLAALGVITLTDVVARLIPRLLRRTPATDTARSEGGLSFSLTCMALLAVGIALSTQQDYTVDWPSTYEMNVTKLLLRQVDAAKARGGGVALVTNDLKKLTLEEINSNQYRLALRSTYRYYNIATGDVDPRFTRIDTRPPLYIGGLLDKLKQPNTIPSYCKNIYDVAPDLLPQFKALIAAHRAECPAPIQYTNLP